MGVATIYDVARAAGVTAATVSVALSGRGVVNAGTRERILQCALDLGYRPNLVGRSLSTRRTHTVGLVIYDITNPFYAEVALAAEQTARDAGYRLIFANTTIDPDFGAELLQELAGRQVDGIIAMPGGLRADALRAVAETGLPTVACLWDEEQSVRLPYTVGVDFGAGGRQVADYLLDLGHERVAMVAIGADSETFLRAREVAFTDRLAARGHAMPAAYWQWADSTLESGYQATRVLLDRPEPPTAIYATNDIMAMGVLAAAREAGVPVPSGLSVVGFDDIKLARYMSPPLTTIRIEKDVLMAEAMHVLLHLIEGEEVTPPPSRIPRLIERQSSGPPVGQPQSPRRKEVVGTV